MANTLIGFLDVEWTANIVNAAVTASLAYDIAHSFTDEVKYIWCGMRWSIPKVLYMITRYYCILYLLILIVFRVKFLQAQDTSIATCQAYIWFHGVAGIVIIGPSVDLIFMLRVTALYGNDLKVVLFLTIGLAVDFTTGFILTIIMIISEVENANVFPVIGCAIEQTAHLDLLSTRQSISFGISLAFKTVLFTLSISKVGQYYIHDHGGIWLMFQNETATFNPVLRTIFRDGTLYFGILLVATITMTIFSLDVGLTNIAVILNLIYFGISSFSASRLILDLRKLSDDNTNHNTTAMSRSIFFAQPRTRVSNQTSDGEHTGRDV